MNITFLDSYTLNPGDLNLSSLEALGHCKIYPSSTPKQIVNRCTDAEIIITNKCLITSEMISALPRLKYVQVAATGYNNIDLAAAKMQSIPVSNVSGYSTKSVAQHTFAMLLGYLNQTELYSQETAQGKWSSQTQFSYWHQPIEELAGKTLGIIGLGTIGQQVAAIGRAFGMTILSLSRGPKKDTLADVTYLQPIDFYQQSDIITLHCPLTPQTESMINRDSLAMMTPDTILINTSRGGTVHESDLKAALQSGQIKAALLDVLSSEPPPADHILLNVPNCHITPHQAWGSLQALQRLLDGIVGNIKAYQAGSSLLNLVG